MPMSQAEANIALELLADLEQVLKDVAAAEEAKLPAPYNTIVPPLVSPALNSVLSKMDALVKAKIAAAEAPAAPAAPAPSA